jgi:Trm5-related predicted tRNA methylase
MLRITSIETERQRKLVLEGKLIEPWVTEFKKAWHEAKVSLNGHKLVIDLCNVTVISPQAEVVLLEIKREGARFVCGGILNKHVVRRIERECECN